MKLLRDLLHHIGRCQNGSPAAPNRLIYLDKPENFSDDIASKLDAHEDAVEALAEDHPDRERLEKSLRAIQTVYENLNKDGIDATEKGQLEELMRNLVGSQLDTRVSHLEVKGERKLDQSEVKGKYLHQIAAAHGMTQEELIRFNKDMGNEKFHVVKATKGRAYCYANDEVYVPIKADELAARTSALEAAQDEIISDAGATTLETVRSERAARYAEEAQVQEALISERQTALTSEVLANHEDYLRGTTAKLPMFLQGDRLTINNEDWAELLKRAGQTENAQSKRLVDLIDDAPLSWSASEFRNVIRGSGLNNVLSFKDITKHEFGENQNQFFKRYEELPAEITHLQPEIDAFTPKVERLEGEVSELEETLYADLEDHPEYKRKERETADEWGDRILSLGETDLAETELERKIIPQIDDIDSVEQKIRKELQKEKRVRTEQKKLVDEQARRESIMVQAYQIFQAMEEMVEGVEINEDTAFRQYSENSEMKSVESVEGATALYDIDLILMGEVTEADGAEGIGTTDAIINEVKGVFEGIGISDRHEKNIDAGFVLRVMDSCYGMDLLMKNGHVVKNEENGALYLVSTPNTFTAENLGDITESFKMKCGDLMFDAEAATEFRLAVLRESDPEAYARELAAVAFENRGKRTITMEDAEAGDALLYKKTDEHLLATIKDAESALEDLLTHRRYFTEEGGIEGIDHEALLSDLNYFLNTGIDNYFQDSEIDTVKILEDLGFDMDKDEKKRIKKIDKEI
ncbi:MAG: hypothetical protein Q8P27_01975, partial [Candidatus Peregrinibacteria bacterium]|nr:hypothetical protein [Candidatus Peregrinibacteria bacterium]